MGEAVKNESMSLVEVLRIVLWEDRRRVTTEDLEEASKLLFEEMGGRKPEEKIMGLAEKVLRGRVPEDELDEWGRECINRVFASYLDRGAPPRGTPPTNEAAARAYLRRSLYNAFMSAMREQKRMREKHHEYFLEQTGGPSRKRRQLDDDSEGTPSLLDLTPAMGAQPDVADLANNDDFVVQKLGEQADEEAEDDYDFPTEEQEWEEDDFQTLEAQQPKLRENAPGWESEFYEAIKELKFRIRPSRRLLDDEELKVFQESLDLFFKAVALAKDTLRRQSDKKAFAESFCRLVRLFLEKTTMEEEVQRKWLDQGKTPPQKENPEYVKERNRLDQANRRALSRILETMIELGADKDMARKIIQAISLRGAGAQSGEVSEK